MPEYKSDLGPLFDESDQRGQRYLSLLQQEGDIVSVALRGHLIVEEILFRVVQSHCDSPEHIEDARLRFPQLVALAQSLEKLPAAPPSVWASLKNLNSLRNALAHNLEPSNLESRLESFVKSTLGPEQTAKLAQPLATKESLTTALCFLLGQLQVVGLFTEALEYLVVKQLSGSTE